MVENLLLYQIYDFIVKDFRGAWDSIAANPNQSIGRGNFMFARQVMSLLEFAARCYGRNAKLCKRFSDELFKIEPKYFTSLPRTAAPFNQDFELPRIRKRNILLWSLFDLIRNGLAHQYQQILVKLTDGKHFYITLYGAAYHRYLSNAKTLQSPTHLGYAINAEHDLKLLLDPGILFLHLEDAVLKSDLLSSAHSFRHLTRPKSKLKYKRKSKSNLRPIYNFGVKSLEKSLVAGNHINLSVISML
jgi:hypothetical protein